VLLLPLLLLVTTTTTTTTSYYYYYYYCSTSTIFYSTSTTYTLPRYRRCTIMRASGAGDLPGLLSIPSPSLIPSLLRWCARRAWGSGRARSRSAASRTYVRRRSQPHRPKNAEILHVVCIVHRASSYSCSVVCNPPCVSSNARCWWTRRRRRPSRPPSLHSRAAATSSCSSGTTASCRPRYMRAHYLLVSPTVHCTRSLAAQLAWPAWLRLACLHAWWLVDAVPSVLLLRLLASLSCFAPPCIAWLLLVLVLMRVKGEL